MKKFLLTVLLGNIIIGMQKQSEGYILSKPAEELYTHQNFEKSLHLKYPQFKDPFLVAQLNYTIHSKNNIPLFGSIYNLREAPYYSGSDVLKLLVAKTVQEMKKSDNFIIKVNFKNNPAKLRIIYEELGFEVYFPSQTASLICEPEKIKCIKEWAEMIEAQYTEELSNAQD